MNEQVEIDSYWTREAAKAYAERRAAVHERLTENGGVVERWMVLSITRDDLKAELATAPVQLH